MASRRRRASMSRILSGCRWPPRKPRLWRRPTPTRRSRQKSSIKPFPIRRVRVRPAVHTPLSPAVDPTAATQAGVVASASPLAEPSESAQGSEPPAASSHATKSAAAQRPSTAVKKQQRIAHVQSRRRNDERDDYCVVRQSWELLVWPHLCRCLLFARPISLAASPPHLAGNATCRSGSRASRAPMSIAAAVR